MIKFSTEECKLIINLAKSYSKKHSSTLFNNESIDYFYYCIIREDKSQWIFDRIKEYLNSNYPDNIANLMPEIYVHQYPLGCKFSLHRDDVKYPDQVLNVGTALNDDYSGGEFVLHKPFLILDKIPGSIYNMKASRPHEVYEITEGERWSMIIFFTREQLGISKSLV